MPKLESHFWRKVLLDHPLSYALTATADVPVAYLQQFWRTISKVPDTKDTIKFMLDTEELTYTVDMFRDTLHLQVETPENSFFAPVNIQSVEAFMNRFGYQGLVDKDFMNNVFQKKEAIQYPRFTKLIIVDLMKKFPNIPQRIEEYYHSIKDDIMLVSVYTTGNVLVRGMLIPDEFLTEEIRTADDFTESTPRAHRTSTLTIASPKGNKKKESIGETSSPQKSLKITIRQKHVDEKKGDKIGTLEIRTEKMQTLIHTTLRSPRINLSLGVRDMIQNMERKCVTTDEF
nr:hypothetical protein [Tanacetum cinerariifolium]